MKKNILVIVAVIAALVIGVCGGMYMNPAQEKSVNIAEEVAANTGSAGIMMAVIDDQKIMQEAKVYVSLRKDYESKIVDLKEKADEEKAMLKKENDRIAAMRATATQEEFNKEVAAFAEKQKKSSDKINTQAKELETAYVAKINEIKAEGIDVILAEIAKEQKLSFITSKMVSFYYNPSLDVTDVVISRLNKKISKAKLDM